MNKTNRFWSSENISILLGLLIGQILLFYILIEDKSPDALSRTLSIIVWFGGTALAIMLHIILFLFSSRKSLFGIAMLVSILFWTVAWISYNYIDRTKGRREMIKISDDVIKGRESGKSYVEELFRERNILATWLPDSLCYIVYREDGTCYYITAGGSNGEGITTFEKSTSPLGLKDTATWTRGLKNIIPLLNIKQLSLLDRSLKDKTFCLSRVYEGFSCTYPCWRTVVSQRYDSLTARLYTSMHFPY